MMHYFFRLLLLLLITGSFCRISADSNNENTDDEYEQYVAGLPLYEEPLSLPRDRGLDPNSLSWVPSSHVVGLNIFGLVPSAYIGVGWVDFESVRDNSTLVEYNWGYRVFSWISLAFAYQNQSLRVKELSDQIWSIGKRQYKDNTKFAIHSLMFKGYLESPRVLRIDRFFLTPYVAMGIGPGWVQRGIYGTSVSAWEADAGIRFGAIHPISFLSLMFGGKYIEWGDLGKSFVQYLGLRLNF
ncbi:MAG: hypothetical protein S4CHLAM7_09230 [Chlamydiae bacterium]|nr:hypothetical protein [Chlamydiota bacterium]